eukprot:TRINITY_DN526_c0_g1_i10.p1 TRINITY_DN526_c0_g1~~TRINITY_DN526_c0_g1_i10.p1  ORF type:complete len:202 (-),score=26.46 TRINITY_DN526_c0_g1_i10:366-971(-)
MGGLKYVLCYAAAAHLVRFGALALQDKIFHPVSNTLNLTLQQDRLQAFVGSVNIGRILRTFKINGLIPEDAFPLFSEQKHGTSTIRITDEYVEKVVPLACEHMRGTWLCDLYDRLSKDSSVAADRQCVRCCVRHHTTKDNTLVLYLIPVGFPKEPCDESECVLMCRCVLRALRALHSLQSAHRDIRWEVPALPFCSHSRCV